MAIRRNFDIRNLVRELAENKVSALEVIREALSNARDHEARLVWIQTEKDPRNDVTVLIADDGEGMSRERLEAFWGIGASAKADPQRSIGYKGHGTKLFFDCQRLSVATRTDAAEPWLVTTLEAPLKFVGDEIPEAQLAPGGRLYRTIEELGLKRGTVILIEQVGFEDRSNLLLRPKIESYCDWFTTVGDIRSGLFDTRLAFHRAIAERQPVLEELRLHERELRPIEVRLRVNGEKAFSPLGLGSTNKDFFHAWKETDVANFKEQPGLLAYGHRFADFYESAGGASRARDDRSSIRLTGPANWATENGIAIVGRVEGHRRQLDTYLEASWQGHPAGVYKFEQRFGLWLCRDFIPVSQRNDLLREALERASRSRLRFETGNLRNWKIFINYQLFRPTANRNDISNESNLETRIFDALSTILEDALKNKSFQDWVQRLRNATLERWKKRELDQMRERLEDVEAWVKSSPKKDGIDPMDVTGLPELAPNTSLLLKAPSSEQELFYVYGLLSGRFTMPIHIVEYDASEGVDAIGILRVPSLVAERKAHVRVEFKLDVAANNPIHHFFEAIDVIICWKVGKVGDIFEESSATAGTLRKRGKPALTPPIDTHEILYTDEAGRERVIPIVELSELFPPLTGGRRGKKG